MKTGVEQQQYWLLQKTGIVIGTSSASRSDQHIRSKTTFYQLVEPLVRALTVYFCYRSFKFGPDVHSRMRVSGEDWVLANINVSGYFRVNYDLDNWDRLLSLLNTDHQVSHMHLSKCALPG